MVKILVILVLGLKILSDMKNPKKNKYIRNVPNLWAICDAWSSFPSKLELVFERW